GGRGAHAPVAARRAGGRPGGRRGPGGDPPAGNRPVTISRPRGAGQSGRAGSAQDPAKKTTTVDDRPPSSLSGRAPVAPARSGKGRSSLSRPSSPVGGAEPQFHPRRVVPQPSSPAPL